MNNKIKSYVKEVYNNYCDYYKKQLVVEYNNIKYDNIDDIILLFQDKNIVVGCYDDEDNIIYLEDSNEIEYEIILIV